MAMPTEMDSVTLGEPRSRTDLVLEIIALRHQIAVLKRSGTRRPCFGLWDRLFWILLSWWWPRWPESLLIIQPQTVKRWRRNGWFGLWGYRSRGRWRGGRPRVSREVRELIARMARENFLWGAPRIHGELLMLGYKVSQATVSRYLSTLHRRPGQSWRTFIRNQAFAFSYSNDLDDGNQDYQSLVECSYGGQFAGSAERIVRHGDNRSMSYARDIAVRGGAHEMLGIHTFRRGTAPDRSLTEHANALSVSAQMEIRRIAPRFLKAAGSQKDVDQVLRSDRVLTRHFANQMLEFRRGSAAGRLRTSSARRGESPCGATQRRSWARRQSVRLPS
jgi:hypothetical protein